MLLLIDLLEQIEKNYIRKHPYRPIICNEYNSKEYSWIYYMEYNIRNNCLECTLMTPDEFEKYEKDVIFPQYINAENIRDEVLYYTKYIQEVSFEKLKEARVVYKYHYDEEWKDFEGYYCKNNYTHSNSAEIHLVL